MNKYYMIKENKICSAVCNISSNSLEQVEKYPNGCVYVNGRLFPLSYQTLISKMTKEEKKLYIPSSYYSHYIMLWMEMDPNLSTKSILSTLQKKEIIQKLKKQLLQAVLLVEKEIKFIENGKEIKHNSLPFSSKDDFLNYYPSSLYRKEK